MLLRRIIFGALMHAARNPAVQKRLVKLLARRWKQQNLDSCGRVWRAGELTRKAKDKVKSSDK